MSALRKILVACAAASLTVASGAASAQSAELPVPCVAGVCGANIAGFVSAGRANAVITNNVVRVQQQTDRAILNWASFNVGPDGRVIFEQPSSSSIALNRIFQGSPSRIMGAIEANGQIFLVNQNGFLFGPSARVRTAGLLVSSLNMLDSTFDNGLLSPDLLRNGRAALESDGRMGVLDPQGNPVLGDDGNPLEVKVTISPGAHISTVGAGGRVMIASRTVDNAGQIETPDGQVILAAGEKVYLQASTDPALRGLLVEVDAGGEAWNRMTGSINAVRGNVSMVGLAVNQQGRVSATSTVSANGSIRLLARDSVRIGLDTSQNPHLLTDRGGQLTLGAQSQTTVLPELADRTTAIDEQAQLPSQIELSGREVFVRGGAQVRAAGGTIKIRALNERVLEEDESLYAPDAQARVRVESGAVLDVSGSDATASVSRNVVRVELRGNELRDAPLQRDGPLRGKEVFVDARVGTPLADVSGAIAGIGRAIDERTSVGGTISVESAGDISVATGAIFDVSGGTMTYTGGAVQTTQLIGADGRAVDIGQANPNQSYVGLINPTSERRFDRWGVTEQVQGPLIGRYEPGYAEGRSAGTLQFAARGLALDGTFLGAVTTGATQRDPARAPLGGRLVIGLPLRSSTALPDYLAPSINLVDQAVPISVADDASLPQRPLDLSVSFATAGGFTRTELYSNGVVNIPESMMLALAPGSSLRITAHRVEAGGSISAPGGSLRFVAVETSGVDQSVLPRTGVVVGDHATLDVRGLWNNELSLLTPIYRDGGEIDLAVRMLDGELVLGDGVRLLASGGASLSATGSVTGGRGGRIALRAGAGGGAIDMGADVETSAFGVSGARGGTFVLEAPRLEIVAEANTLNPESPRLQVIAQGEWTIPQRLDLRAGDDGFFVLGESLFTDFGFASFDLTATAPRAAGVLETLAVREGANVSALAQTLWLDDGLAARVSGGTVDGFARAVLAPDYLRGASSISLRVEPRDFNGADNVGRLTIERNATVRVEPRGTVSLSSVGGISVAGNIVAPGGSVNAFIPNPLEAFDGGFRDDLGITLLGSARIDVAGRTLRRPSDAGLMQGEVIAGGSVSLLADRGFVEVLRGADIDVRGTASEIDVPGGTGGFLRRSIASAAGSITLRAPERLTFQAALHAQAGLGDTRAAAGSASFQLTRQRGFQPGLNSFIDTYSSAPRTLLVTTDPATVSEYQNGVGVIDVGILRAAGIDALSLEAGHRVEFYAGADLNLARSLQIAAPLLGLSGDAVNLAAPYISIGTTVDTTQSAAPAPLPGLGRLNVSGDLVELTGYSAITGVASATFDARTELRMRGFIDGANSTGELRIAGDLNLRSPLIYPTTGTKFSIFAAGGANDRVTFDSLGTSVDRVPLSVGGALDVNARSIVQRTRLIAPFGQISLNATDDLLLAAGSVTSVSAAGSLLPYGRVQLGSQWVYDMAGTLISEPRLETPAVNLAARDLDIDAAATVDLKGGGDLYAYEWMPGAGGSRDALAPGATPGLYAILPSMRDGFAPFDPQEFLGSDLKPGDSIYLAGGNGLPPGVYPLLPARYALLPGAMLVSAVPGIVDAAPGVTTLLADGTPVVAGYRTFAGTGIRDARMSGYTLRPGSDGRQLATYQDSRTSTFAAAARPVTPDDAARMTLTALRSVDLAGRVLTAANGMGVGASIDIAAPSLAVRGAGGASVDGAVNVDASVLQGWNAASLLLGGRRGPDGRTVAVTSDRLIFTSGVSLAGTEVIAVANEDLRLETGSLLASTGANTALPFEEEAPIRLVGEHSGAAVLGVSSARALHVERSGATDTGGGIVIAAGARLASGGALLMDGPQSIVADGTVAGVGATWALGSGDINFGGAPGVEGFTIDTNLLAGLSLAARLRVSATQRLSFAQALRLDALDQVILDTPLLRSAGAVNVSLAARDILLMNSSAASNAAGSTQGGELSLVARDFTIGPGEVRVDGFDSLSIDAQREIVGVGPARLTAGGDVLLSAANLGAGSDADLTISAAGLLRTTLSAPLTDTGRVSGELGGRIALAGTDIEHGGAIRVASGRVELTAAHSLLLAAGSLIDASGVQVSAADRSVGSAGGAVRLTSGGTLNARAGAQVRVSGAGEADAGSVGVKSAGHADLGASFLAQAATAARGGRFQADLGSLEDFTTLNRALENGEFRDRRAVHVAQGDLVLASGDAIVASEVSLVSDAGALRIGGLIEASSDHVRSRIELAGGSGLTLEGTARLRAQGTGELGRGGSVLLASQAGEVNLDRGSSIAVGGAHESGQLTIRAAATADGMRLGALESAISGADLIALQPVLRFDLDTDPDATVFAQIRDSATDYMAIAGPALNARFGNLSTAVAVRPGIDLFTAGDLNLDTTAGGFAQNRLDFAGWRFGGEAATVAFHATGAIDISGTVSDGFQVIGAGANQRIDLLDGNSSSLAFVAGTDLRIHDGARVRTGTGDLSLRAGGDLTFGEGASVYTGGLAGEPTHLFARGASLALATRGGTLELTAGGSVLGSPVQQAVGEWQVRQGRAATNPASSPGWGTDIELFGWNAGTLGGGDLLVRAGRDIRDLSAAAADSASINQGVLTRFGGGVVQFDAERDITSAFVHMTRGTNLLRAGGEIGASRAGDGGELLGSLFSMQAASLDLFARRGIIVESMFNPTTLQQAQTAQNFRAFFLSYDPQSALHAFTATGDLQLSGGTDQRLIPYLGLDLAGTSDPLLSLLPPNVVLHATDGDIRIRGPATMAPADHGQLELFSSRDILGTTGSSFIMSDASAASMPTALTAVALPTISADIVRNAASGRHATDASPLLIHAGRDIAEVLFELAKFTRMSAGRDVRNVTLKTQNVRPSDLTLISAGRDFIYDIDAGNKQVEIGGAGRLDVLAGRDVDLGFSEGIASVGRLVNPSLTSERGADITILAGAGAALAPTEFLARIVAPIAGYRAALQSYVAGISGVNGESYESSVTRFGAFAADLQRAFLLPVFFTELVASGRDANRIPGAGFDRGYAAIDALFPGSRNPTSSARYDGDVKLAFSRIYTLADADISLLAPGGLLNVGLANPPPGLAGSRTPSQLGIVAQRAGSVRIFTHDDVLVNQSRVFTLSGGDIAIWSTIGDIDAGRGAKSAISAPPPTVLVDATGRVTLDFAGAVAGSGIRAIVTDDNIEPGDVDLIAPAGIVDAGDAGIGSAGNLNVAAQQVVGLDNIQVGGTSTGVPAETSSLGASLSGASAVGSGANSAAGDAVGNGAAQQAAAPLADSAFGFLDVFLEGFGTEVCKPDDTECLKRNQK